MVKEISTKDRPLNLVIVDWASASQHEGNGTPVRDKVDLPVLQSPFWLNQGSIICSWFKIKPKLARRLMSEDKVGDLTYPEVGQWLQSILLLDKDGRIIASHPIMGGVADGRKLPKVDLKKAQDYQSIKKLLTDALGK